LSRVKSLDGPGVRVISPIGKKKVYDRKDLRLPDPAVSTGKPKSQHPADHNPDCTNHSPIPNPRIGLTVKPTRYSNPDANATN